MISTGNQTGLDQVRAAHDESVNLTVFLDRDFSCYAEALFWIQDDNLQNPGEGFEHSLCHSPPQPFSVTDSKNGPVCSPLADPCRFITLSLERNVESEVIA